MPLYGGPLDGTVQLKNLLRKGLENTPDEPALVSIETRWKWRELDTAAERLARNLLGLGLRAGASRPTAQDLIKFARARVGYKAPEEIVVLNKMPISPTGKIDRAALKRLAARCATD